MTNPETGLIFFIQYGKGPAGWRQAAGQVRINLFLMWQWYRRRVYWCRY